MNRDWGLFCVWLQPTASVEVEMSLECSFCGCGEGEVEGEMRGNAKLFSGAARPTDVQGCSSPFRAGDGLTSALPGVDKAGQTGQGSAGWTICGDSQREVSGGGGGGVVVVSSG
jgi:hypothetical protein